MSWTVPLMQTPLMRSLDDPMDKVCSFSHQTFRGLADTLL